MIRLRAMRAGAFALVAATTVFDAAAPVWAQRPDPNPATCPPTPKGTAFGVFRKGGDEYIVNLGFNDDFTNTQIDLSTLPPKFKATGEAAASLIGATFSMVGVVRPGCMDTLPSDPANPVPQPNFLISGENSPNSLSDNNIISADTGLNSPVDGFVLAHSDLTVCPSSGCGPDPEVSFRTFPNTDTRSLAAKLGSAQIGTYNLNVSIKRHGRATGAPGWGVLGSLEAGGGPGRLVSADSFPLKVDLQGHISRFTESDRALIGKGIEFAVFTKGNTEFIVNLGEVDAVATGPVITLPAPPAAFSGSYQGATLAVVGFFDDDNPRNNILFSDPAAVGTTPSATLTGARVNTATTAAETFFLNTLASTLPGQGTAIALGTGTPPANSFTARFGCAGVHGAGAGTICTTALAAGATTVALGGAANTPLEQGIVQTATVNTTTGTFTTDEVPFP